MVYQKIYKEQIRKNERRIEVIDQENKDDHNRCLPNTIYKMNQGCTIDERLWLKSSVVSKKKGDGSF